MKRYFSLIILGVLIALAGFAVYAYFSKGQMSTVGEPSRDFAYRDTASIDKIFIADKDGHSSTLERTAKGWFVNGKYKCRPDAVLNLLEVIKLVEVRMPVRKEAKESVLKFMASNANKVEIYSDGELVKQYYVGHETEDYEGSYMLLTDISSGENYEEPYVCFIPGFRGFLLPRFIVNENEWRDRVVMNYTPPQVRMIKVEHLGMPPDSSFTIELKNVNSFVLRDLKGQELPFDEGKLRQYLVYYQNVSYEGLITGKNKKLQDSLSAGLPFAIISVTTNEFKTSEFKFYRKAFSAEKQPEHGVKYDYDPDRMFLNFATKEWALVQYFVFGKMLATSAYFMSDKSVKK
jgi:hypothetical protein